MLLKLAVLAGGTSHGHPNKNLMKHDFWLVHCLIGWWCGIFSYFSMCWDYGCYFERVYSKPPTRSDCLPTLKCFAKVLPSGFDRLFMLQVLCMFAHVLYACACNHICKHEMISMCIHTCLKFTDSTGFHIKPE